MSYLTDIEIAQETKLERIENVAAKIGIPADELEHYGKYIAKFNNDQGHTTYLMFSPNEELMSAFKKIYSRKIYAD